MFGLHIQTVQTTRVKAFWGNKQSEVHELKYIDWISTLESF